MQSISPSPNSVLPACYSPTHMDTHFFPLQTALSCSSSSPSSETHSNCVCFSISVSHTHLAGQRVNWHTPGRYGDPNTGTAWTLSWRNFSLACRSGFMSYRTYLSAEMLESPPALSQSWAGVYQKELSHGVWKRRLQLLVNS